MGGANAGNGPAGSSGVSGSDSGGSVGGGSAGSSGSSGAGGSAGRGGAVGGGNGGASGRAGAGGGGAGAGTGGATGNACTDQEFVSASEPNSNFAHFHGVAIASAELEAFLASGMASTQYTMSVADNHAHTLTLMRAHAESLRSGSSVSVGSSFDAEHSHLMRLSCV
jgi:hypothetical protein